MKLADLRAPNKTSFIVAIVCLILCIISLIMISNSTKSINKNTDNLMETIKVIMVDKLEQGYAQGQLDASKGIMRIRMIDDSTCVWTSSPWGKVKPLNDTVRNLKILH